MDFVSEPKNVVVVGGGLAGLSAAAYLSRAGLGVTLFEKSPHLGGRAATRQYAGYYFNRGAHALYTGGAGERVLRELGVSYTGHSPREAFALHQGRLRRAPYDALSLLRSNLLSLADKLEMVRWFGAVARLDAHAMREVSVQAWLERSISRPSLRRMMAALARTLVFSAALDLVSAEVFISLVQMAFKHPVLYIDGGWQTLVDGLRRAAEEAGTRIVSGARVEAVTGQAGYVQGVRLYDGSSVAAAVVVVATPPRDAARLLAGIHPGLRQVVDALVPARLACLDVALRRLPDVRYLAVQDMDQARFMSTQSVFARVAPQGGALIHTLKQLDPRQSGDALEDQRDLEDLLDRVQPGWRDVLVKRVYLPRIEAVSALPTAAAGGFAGRPGARVPGLAGLYLAGDWIGPEGFLSNASLASGRQAAELARSEIASRPAMEWAPALELAS